jgi:hypothetical protein
MKIALFQSKYGNLTKQKYSLKENIHEKGYSQMKSIMRTLPHLFQNRLIFDQKSTIT